MTKKVGRPQAWTVDAEAIAQVEALSAVLNQSQIADYFGIGVQTFRDYKKRDERISVAYKKGRAKSIAVVAGSLLAQARAGNITAMIFYLKTQAGWAETAHHVLESSSDYEQRVGSHAAILDDPEAQKIAVNLYERLHGIPELPALPFSSEDAGN
tara:strand:+ start:1429 stop:1893 length:465 start_codon:yes stop_codon:yes gene_type:complete